MMNFHKISSKFTFTRRSSRLSWRSICPSEISPESSHEQFSIHNRHTIAKSHPSHRITLWSHPSCLGTSTMTARSPTNATPFRWGIDFNTFNNPSYTRFQSNDPSIDPWGTPAYRILRINLLASVSQVLHHNPAAVVTIFVQIPRPTSRRYRQEERVKYVTGPIHVEAFRPHSPRHPGHDSPIRSPHGSRSSVA